VIVWQLVGEHPLGELARLPTQRDDLLDQRIGVRRIELTPADPADLTVFAVRAEQTICFMQKVKRVFNHVSHHR
jgi:hypothetical protein